MNKKRMWPDALHEEGLTYDDYAAIPEVEGVRYELADGKLELMTAPETGHQMVAGELVTTVKRTCEENYVILFAPVDVILSGKEVRQPDIVMIHRSRVNIIRRRGIVGPPDLVVEILSPSTIKKDRSAKLKSYARFGIPEYWIVEPNGGTLEQYVLSGEAYELEEVYADDQPIRSGQIACMHFTMRDIMSGIPAIAD